MNYGNSISSLAKRIEESTRIEHSDELQLEEISGIPMIPLRGISLFPYMVVSFDIGRPSSIRALEAAMAKDQMVFLAMQKDMTQEAPEAENIYEVGNIAKVRQMLKLPGDSIRVLVEGVQRATRQEVIHDRPYFYVKVQPHIDEIELSTESYALMRSCIVSFEKYVAVHTKSGADSVSVIHNMKEPGRVCDVISAQLNIKNEDKQAILEEIDVVNRLDRLLNILIQEIEIAEIEREIGEKVKGQISKSQKEYYLREQIKAIRHELGDDDDFESEVPEMKAKLKKLKLPKKLEKKVEKEIDRYARLSPSSAESGVIRSYVNTILDLPWKKRTKERYDLVKAEVILDEDHYGLVRVKERVLEFLAVKQLTKSMKGPIICLVGPPGVGKTSVAKSIARALNRNFVRMSLGGVRDESEIRGHRRTYIGAIPGRIINGIKEAGTNNPLFLFDEIDKISSDFRGDPASALLEVLDPEQNKEFTDHYLEMPFDLSDVMFITTANSLAPIPRPLLDRMEVIELNGYTEMEKVNISKKYLITKKMEEHGLAKGKLSISDDALLEIIRHYTRESGVRNLERNIADICRKAAVRLVKESVRSVKISDKNVARYLGKEKYHYDLVGKSNQVGVVTGLAWTSVGGDTLSIEVNVMEGTGKLKLTGQLGDVMKESAQAALSYARTVTSIHKIDDEFYKNKDIHIHVPEGAIPKDGPSAGITMGTAIVSALSGKPVNRFVAMTGEITLRGRVLPIGGLKEKSLAAMRAGIKTVLIPYDNIKDLEEIPDIVKETMNFIPVKTMDEVLAQAFKVK